MAEKNNATCSICGKNYHKCLSCKDSMKLQPWKDSTDTAEHYKVFQVVKGYSTGVYTKDEAKIKFKNIDLKDIESFRPHIKEIIKDILKEEKPIVKAVEKIESIKEINKTEIIEVEDNAIVENNVKPIVSRKKNYKVETE